MDNILLISVVTVGLVSILGFFFTKSKGYGKYTTSIFLILVTLVLASILFVTGNLESDVMANIAFAVIGFAGGLFANSKE